VRATAYLLFDLLPDVIRLFPPCARNSSFLQLVLQGKFAFGVCFFSYMAHMNFIGFSIETGRNSSIKVDMFGYVFCHFGDEDVMIISM